MAVGSVHVCRKTLRSFVGGWARATDETTAKAKSTLIVTKEKSLVLCIAMGACPRDVHSKAGEPMLFNTNLNPKSWRPPVAHLVCKCTAGRVV